MHALADSSVPAPRRAANADAAAAGPGPPAVTEPRRPVALFAGPAATRAAAFDGDDLPRAAAGERLIGVLPPLYPEWLGDRAFARSHGARFPYVVGEMARGIATAEMVVAAARAGLCAFFGSAGLPPREIAAAIDLIAARLGPSARSWGANLIHSPHDPDAEMAFARLALDRAVPLVSASAFMRLGPAVVLLAARGLRRDGDGRVVRARQVFAKVSRAEVARQFLAPAPEALLRPLVAAGLLSAAEADLAARVPVAGDVTVEADSGGHTDNRPLTVLLPELLGLAHRIAAQHGYAEAPRVGAAGGLGTPAALAAAFAAGAAYVVTGSINQCTVESGLSPAGRRMLAAADATDVAMAPAADMFELGVKVQVLKRGTLFAQRGARLYDAYRRHAGLADIPAAERDDLERNVLGRGIDAIWADTRAHFAAAAPAEIERARADPKHKMALVFRWYLFMGAQWAREGAEDRRADYQIWCGPAMGAFNRWAEGSFLHDADRRDVAQLARNLLEGAAHVARAQALRQAGVALPAGAFDYRPRPLA
jgi:PfaD family protein